MNNPIPVTTIDILARSIFKEASSYGFGRLDIIRLINELMDLCTAVEGSMQNRPGEQVEVASHSDKPMEFPLIGERLKIRAYNGNEDEKLLDQWLPDKYGRYFALSCATAQSLTIDTLVNGASNHFGVITLLDDKPIGAMAYLDHSKSQKRAELRKLIGDLESRGQGLAEEATRLWIDYGVNTLGLGKIYVSTLQTQINNIKLNESIGFKVEGLLRNEVLIDGVRHDMLRMGLWIE